MSESPWRRWRRGKLIVGAALLLGALLLARAPAEVSAQASGARPLSDAEWDAPVGTPSPDSPPPQDQPADTAPAPDNTTPPAVPRPIVYEGRAQQDDRRAAVELTIQGQKVTGRMSIQSICTGNIFLGGASFEFEGTLTGPWEGRTSSIDGTWTGYDLPCAGGQVPNRGEFKFFRKEEQGIPPALHFRVTGLRGRYGYNFAPHERVYTQPAGAGAGITVVAPDVPFDSPLGPPGPGYTTGATPPQAFHGMNENDLRRIFTVGVITLQVGETHLQQLPSSGSRKQWDGQTVSSNSDPCVPDSDSFPEVRPAGLAEAAMVGSAVRVVGTTRGEGELWVWGRLSCSRPDGTRYRTLSLSVYLLLVGDEAIDRYRKAQGKSTGLPPPPPGDIAQAVVRGVAKKVGSGRPVAGARVSLVYPEGGGVTEPTWLTRTDGRFEIVARNLHSGRYQVMVQLLNRLPDDECQIPKDELKWWPPGGGVACDLWPVEEVYVSLSRDDPKADAGVIWLDYVRNIWPP